MGYGPQQLENMNRKRICNMVSVVTAGLLIVPFVANAQRGTTSLTQSKASLATSADITVVNKLVPSATKPDAQLELIKRDQVMAVARKTFPKLSQGLNDAELLRRIQSDPILMGILRGRLAEEDFFNRNPSWKPVASKIAPQNDGWRWVNGVVGGRKEGVQIKALSDWKDYFRAMQKDDKAEFFAIPDDQYNLVYQDLEKRRLGAIRGGLADKAASYANEQQRLMKLGGTFERLDCSIMGAGLESELLASGKIAMVLQSSKNLVKDSAALGKAGKALTIARTETAVAATTETAAVEEVTAVAATETAETAGGFAFGDFIIDGACLLLCW
jgi:hypothetical protein